MSVLFPQSDMACRVCHNRLGRLEEPIACTDDVYIGPHDRESQEVVKRGKYEGTTKTRYTHLYEYVCNTCNCLKTADQVEPWEPAEPLPTACQTAPSAGYDAQAQSTW